MKFARWAAAAVTCIAASFEPAAMAAGSVDIYACYACNNTGNVLIDAALTDNPSVSSDGLLFAFINNTGAVVTNAQFGVGNASPADSFNIGTLAAGATFILMPGLSNDGAVHASGGLFETTGTTVDTSEPGEARGVSDTSVFSFTALLGVQALSSGPIVAGDPALIRPWRDAPLGPDKTSFLGNGPSGDGGCGNCYFDLIAAGTLAAVPEPGTGVLLAAGLWVLGFGRRRSAVAAGPGCQATGGH